jgi:hypothetical protein
VLKHRLWFTILWPSFLMACVLEILVFAVVDPGDLHGFNGAPIEWSRQAVYTVSFLVFWCVIATSGALSALLCASARAVNQGRPFEDEAAGSRGP